MMDRDDRSRLRLAMLVALVALALGAASCGGSDDDDGGSGDAASAAQEETQPETFDNTPEGQIKAAHAEFIDVFYKKDAEAICERTTSKGQRLWAKSSSKAGATCEEGVKAFFDGISSLGKSKPRVLKARIDGRRAIAQTKTKSNQIYPVPFLKVNGEWKIDAGGSGT